VPFTLAPAGASDSGFLWRLFESTRGQQVAQVSLAPAHRDALVRMQFSAQQTGYRDQYPQSQDFIVMMEDRPAGRLWLNDSAGEIAIVDIAILPEYQGGGLGTAVLGRIVSVAALTGKAIRLRVDRMNFGAARLYRRLGFEVVSGNEVFEEMELAPGTYVPKGSG
jgi:ribosomal protein S18 acetylase RimI-like enzyme